MEIAATRFLANAKSAGRQRPSERRWDRTGPKNVDQNSSEASPSSMRLCPQASSAIKADVAIDEVSTAM